MPGWYHSSPGFRPSLAAGYPSVVPALLLLLLTVAAAWLWRDPTWRPRPLPGVTRPRPLALGHRGARGPRPENTLAAFELAFRHLDGIETDVQRSRDGVLVLWHDFTCRGREVADSTLDELRSREPDLATLPELFRLASGHPGTLLNLELKSRPRPWRGWALERELVAAVRTSGMADRVLVSSFDPWALARVRLLSPSLRIALLIAPGSPRAWRRGSLAGWLHADALHPNEAQVDAEMREHAALRGLPLHVWTVNEPERMRALVREGVAAVMGDDPAVLARHVKGWDG